MLTHAAVPPVVHWEMTYACPLRCTHCYTESGRRPARQLPLDGMRRLADVLVQMRAQGLRFVGLGGGEPLIVDGFTEIARRLVDGGLQLFINTSGYGLTPAVAERLTDFVSIHVSVDGANAALHDRVRGRNGSFAQAMAALAALDGLAARSRGRGRPLRFGIDSTVVRSTFDHLSLLVTEVAPRFERMAFLSFGPAIPVGLASRESYAPELLTEAQLQRLMDPAFLAELRARARPTLKIDIADVFADFQVPPHRPEPHVLTVEPDGLVRSFGLGGTVGNLLTDRPEHVWQAARARRRHPFVVEQLTPVRSLQDWAAATRRIDALFASPDELVRIARRKPFAA